MKLSSDLCAGISLIGILISVPSAILGIMLMVVQNPWTRYYGPTFIFFGAIPAFLLGLIVFVTFYRESRRLKQIEAEEELIRKLALEKLEKDKLRS